MDLSKQKIEFHEEQFVVFTLGAEEFGVAINEVREIVKWEPLTRIPNTPEYICGVINLRGGIIVVVNLAAKLALEQKAIVKDTRIIVLENNQNSVGVVVDAAKEVLRIADAQIQPPPKFITDRIDHKYLKGVAILGERLLILLDLKAFLDTAEIAKVQKETGG